MHSGAFQFVQRALDGLPPRRFVVEIGARDVNGSVRSLFAGARYLATDRCPGPGVDLVADGATLVPPEPPDTVVCCEVLEHAPNAAAIVANAVRMLAPGGLVILTCATDPRRPHSAIDGGPVRPGEFYANVDPEALAGWLRAAGAERVQLTVDPAAGDLGATAWKPVGSAVIAPAAAAWKPAAWRWPASATTPPPPPPPAAAAAGLRLLLVHPGADWATHDVYAGYLDAFRALGHTVGAFNLNVRIGRAAEWLTWNWRKAGRPDPAPSPADTLYLAGCDVVTAALRGDVDWVVVVTGAYLHPDVLVLLRRARRRLALILTESPYEDALQEKLVPLADVVFTNERTSVPILRRVNPNVYYLPHAYDPARHSPASRDPASEALVPAHDVVFVGTGFQERLDALAAVDWSGIDLGLYGDYSLLGSRARLRRHIRGSVIDNAVTAALYRKAKIGLNLYRRSVSYGRQAPRIEGAASLNPRALELAACGVFTISDRRAEVVEVFGDLVPTFSHPGELEGLIRRWLADDEGRQRIAAELPARVAHSSYTDRAQRVADLLAACGRELDAAAVAGERRCATGEARAGAPLGPRSACQIGTA